MRIKVGTNIIDVNDFKLELMKTGSSVKHTSFNTEELRDNNLDQLSEVLAAKKAIIEALSLPEDSWKLVTVENLSTGKPTVYISENPYKIISSDLSITINSDIAIATYVALVEEKEEE